MFNYCVMYQRCCVLPLLDACLIVRLDISSSSKAVSALAVVRAEVQLGLAWTAC